MLIGFFTFPFGLFVWIFPFMLIVLGIKIIRHIYHSSTRRFDEDYDFYHNYVLKNHQASDQSSLSSTSYSTGEWESKIFKLANTFKGRLTLSDIVLETGLGLKEAEQVIEQMIDGIHVRMEVRDDGIVVYEFPEIIARYENGDSFS